MKTLKITKKMLKMHPADLLVKVGAVDESGRLAYPQHVYFSREDYRELRRNLKTYAKKKSPSASERLLNYSVGVDLLQFGPNETLSEAIRPGYILLDYEAINKAKEQK